MNGPENRQKKKPISIMKTFPHQAQKTETNSSNAFNFSMIASMPPAKFRQFLESLPAHLAGHLAENWALFAREDQKAPDIDWRIWLLMGGRGSGKTRAGAEWIREQVQNQGKHRIALVAPTYTDAREVMLEGESGLLSLGYPRERPFYLSSRRRLEWPNGAVGHVFSAEDPDGLRGPQFDCAWADEFCAWAYPEYSLSNLRMALRLGTSPQLVVTTTPRPIKALAKLIKTRGVVIGRAKTHENIAYLAPNFVADMQETYCGTQLGRQELDGEFIDEQPGALWTRQLIEACRIEHVPDMSRIIVAIDPPVTSGARSDSCGLIVAGLCEDGQGRGHAVILQDGSGQGLTPEGWARRAISLCEQWDGDYLLAEVNQGEEMVRTILDAVEPGIPLQTVYATRSKKVRAEPVALLYEQGRVKHAGTFPELEDELCAIGSTNLRKSPDRADALVWAVTRLLLSRSEPPRVRSV